MKTVLCIVVVLVLVSSTSLAVLPPYGYMGLYIDEHETYCTSGEGFYPVEMWIWCLPSERGMICAEFMIVYPANIIQSTVTVNPEVSVTLGTLDTGMSVCFVDCQWDWQWPFHQALWVTDPTQTEIEIEKHPDPMIECVQFANCETGYPTECCVVHTRLCINYPECPPWPCIGTEEASWGAIKSIIEK
ncbi:MAG: hypothetical protein JSU64_03015 [candidate division WOR-3 bacterium]|nr:MAG: hypothetical protein JSU64_03015 [candidate division WOR-3 bacterium]UCF06931.1 MAG: hypothetical protein JSV33_07900 [bacterium]